MMHLNIHYPLQSQVMGDREPIQGNRVVSEKYTKYTQTLHRNNVKNIQPVVKTAPPPVLPHLIERPKRDQLAQERAEQIERENAILLRKMQRIADGKQSRFSGPFVKDSLNTGKRKREMMRIMQENEALLRRLRERKPVYSVTAFEKDNAVKEERLSRISRFGHQPRITQDPRHTSPTKLRSSSDGTQRSLPNHTSGLRPQPPRSGQPHNDRPQPRLQHKQSPNRPLPASLPPLSDSRKASAEARGVEAQPTSTCIFSQPQLRIGGISSVVSVYERLNPYRLDILARDCNSRSTMQPVSIPFRDLKAAFAHCPDILAPHNTVALIYALLPGLWWLEQGPGLSLQFALEKVWTDASRVQMLLQQGDACELCRPVEDGVVYTVHCQSLPSTCGTTAAFLWLHKQGKFEFLDRTECVSDSNSPAYAKSVCVDARRLWMSCLRLALSQRKAGVEVGQSLGGVVLLRVDVCRMEGGFAQEVVASADIDVRSIIPHAAAQLWTLQLASTTTTTSGTAENASAANVDGQDGGDEEPVHVSLREGDGAVLVEDLPLFDLLASYTDISANGLTITLQAPPTHNTTEPTNDSGKAKSKSSVGRAVFSLSEESQGGLALAQTQLQQLREAMRGDDGMDEDAYAAEDGFEDDYADADTTTTTIAPAAGAGAGAASVNMDAAAERPASAAAQSDEYADSYNGDFEESAAQADKLAATAAAAAAAKAEAEAQAKAEHEQAEAARMAREEQDRLRREQEIEEQKAKEEEEQRAAEARAELARKAEEERRAEEKREEERRAAAAKEEEERIAAEVAAAEAAAEKAREEEEARVHAAAEAQRRREEEEARLRAEEEERKEVARKQAEAERVLREREEQERQEKEKKEEEARVEREKEEEAERARVVEEERTLAAAAADADAAVGVAVSVAAEEEEKRAKVKDTDDVEESAFELEDDMLLSQDNDDVEKAPTSAPVPVPVPTAAENISASVPASPSIIAVAASATPITTPMVTSASAAVAVDAAGDVGVGAGVGGDAKEYYSNDMDFLLSDEAVPAEVETTAVKTDVNASADAGMGTELEAETEVETEAEAEAEAEAKLRTSAVSTEAATISPAVPAVVSKPEDEDVVGASTEIEKEAVLMITDDEYALESMVEETSNEVATTFPAPFAAVAAAAPIGEDTATIATTATPAAAAAGSDESDVANVAGDADFEFLASVAAEDADFPVFSVEDEAAVNATTPEAAATGVSPVDVEDMVAAGGSVLEADKGIDGDKDVIGENDDVEILEKQQMKAKTDASADFLLEDDVYDAAASTTHAATAISTTTTTPVVNPAVVNATAEDGDAAHDIEAVLAMNSTPILNAASTSIITTSPAAIATPIVTASPVVAGAAEPAVPEADEYELDEDFLLDD